MTPELTFAGFVATLLLYLRERRTVRDLTAQRGTRDRVPADSSCTPACREAREERDLYLTALVELAYDPGWPEHAPSRVEEMKTFAFFTLRAATLTQLSKVTQPHRTILP